MAKFSNLKKKVETDVEAKEITVLGERVFVKQSLPTMTQQLVINQVVSTAFLDNGKFSPLLFEVGLALGITLFYSDIAFTQSERQKPMDIYDVLEKGRVYQTIVENIPKEELATLMDLINESIEEEKVYRRSLKGIIGDVLDQVPAVTQAMEKGFSNMTPEQLEQYIKQVKTLKE